MQSIQTDILPKIKIEVAFKHMTRHCTLFIIREVQIEKHTDIWLHPMRLEIIQKLDAVCWGCCGGINLQSYVDCMACE